MIPPLPKNYDVENRGHYSAGHVRPTKKPTKTKATPSTTSPMATTSKARSPSSRAHTIPLRNSSSGYFVPRHTIPSFHSVRIIDRSSV